MLPKLTFLTGLVALLVSTSYLGYAITPVFSQSSSASPRPASSATPSSTNNLGAPNQVPPTGIDLTLSPTFINLVTNPGETVNSQVKIKNNNNFKEYLQIEINKFVPAEGGERPLIQDVTDQDAFAKWVSFDEPKFTLDANETKTINFTIITPKEASLGYYYAFLFTRLNEGAPTGQQAVIAGAPAILTLLEVRTPNATRELQLIDFKTDSAFYEYLPATFNVKVKNSGNIHLAPSGDIFVDRGDKKEIATLRVNESRSNILPNTERVFTSAWNDGFAVRVPKEENGKVVTNDKGETVYRTNYDFTKADRFRIGKYTAHLLMVYDNGQRDVPVEATVSFWVIPWKMILIATVVLIFALLGIKNTVFSTIGKMRKR